MLDVTVVIPSLEKRYAMCQQAVGSVMGQTRACGYIVEVDRKRKGAWETRNKGMMRVESEWTAFLDDDDLLKPEHVDTLLSAAREHGADLVWPWFEVWGGTDPFPHHRGRQWDVDNPHIFPITVLVRTELVQNAYHEMGGFQPDYMGLGDWMVQDYPVWEHIVREQGGKTLAIPDITWIWRHHSNNTSGLPSR